MSDLEMNPVSNSDLLFLGLSQQVFVGCAGVSKKKQSFLLGIYVVTLSFFIILLIFEFLEL